MSEKNKTLIRAFVEAINEQDLPRLRSLVGERFTRRSVVAGEPGIRSAEALIEYLQEEFSTFPDANETLIEFVAEEYQVAAWHRFRGIQLRQMGPYPASGRAYDATYLSITSIVSKGSASLSLDFYSEA